MLKILSWCKVLHGRTPTHPSSPEAQHTVFLNATGIDSTLRPVHNPRVYDTRDILHRHMLPQHTYLLVGRIDSQYNRAIMHNHKHCRFMTVQEICSAYPEIVPLSSHRQSHIDKIEAARNILRKRFQQETISFQIPPKVHGIMVSSNTGIQMWDEAMQVVLDYLSTEDGQIGKLIDLPGRNWENAVPIYAPYFMDAPKGLLGCDHFLTTLQSGHQLIYKHPIANLIRYSLAETVEYVKKQEQKLRKIQKIWIDSDLFTEKQKQLRKSYEGLFQWDERPNSQHSSV